MKADEEFIHFFECVLSTDSWLHRWALSHYDIVTATKEGMVLQEKHFHGMEKTRGSCAPEGWAGGHCGVLI